MKGPIGAALIAAGMAAGVLSAPTAQATEAFSICTPAMGGDNAEGVVVGTPTSCPFAAVVRSAWFTSGMTNPFLAYSPVTGERYPTACEASTETVSGVSISGWTCYAGHNAEVVIWR